MTSNCNLPAGLGLQNFEWQMNVVQHWLYLCIICVVMDTYFLYKYGPNSVTRMFTVMVNVFCFLLCRNVFLKTLLIASIPLFVFTFTNNLFDRKQQAHRYKNLGKVLCVVDIPKIILH